MNTAQIQSLVRASLISVGAILVKKGIVDDAGLGALVDNIIGVAMVAGPVIWAQIHHKNNPPAS